MYTTMNLLNLIPLPLRSMLFVADVVMAVGLFAVRAVPPAPPAALVAVVGWATTPGAIQLAGASGQAGGSGATGGTDGAGGAGSLTLTIPATSGPLTQPRPGFVNLTVDVTLERMGGAAARKLRAAKEITFMAGRLRLTPRGVYVDGERMDHDDLALRAVTAWFVDAGAIRQTPGTITVGSMSSAGVRFRTRPDFDFLTLWPRDEGGGRILATVTFLGSPHAICSHRATYQAFMHWLFVARQFDSRFANRLAKTAPLMIDDYTECVTVHGGGGNAGLVVIQGGAPGVGGVMGGPATIRAGEGSANRVDAP